MSLKEQIDFYREFKDWYFEIINDFKFNHKKDCRASDYLSQILEKKGKNWDLESNLLSFKELLNTKNTILIYGCGPSLEITVNVLLKNLGLDFFAVCINLAADGASVLLKKKGIPIDGLFTDLDGITKEEFFSSEFVFVHAHGDNIDKLYNFRDEILISENVIGTTQVEPSKNLINPGGFTDGDRILYFLRTMLSPKHQIFLIGMDFQNIIGKYSKLDMNENQEGSAVKIKKLKFAIRLIEWLSHLMKNEIYFVNSKFISDKFKYLSIEEFKKKVI